MIIKFIKAPNMFSYEVREELESGGAFSDDQLKEFIEDGFAEEVFPQESKVNPDIETGDLKPSPKKEKAVKK